MALEANNSLDLTNAQALRDYVEDYNNVLIEQMFSGFDSAEYSTAHDGIKGKRYFTTMKVGKLVKRWSKKFNPDSGTLGFSPRPLEVDKVKLELEIYPQDFETSYLGRYRQKGQGMDIPFEGQIMNSVMNKLGQEIEFGFWNAKPSATPSESDFLADTTRGILYHLLEMIASADVTVVGTPGGAVTVDNLLDLLDTMYKAYGTAYKKGVKTFLCSPEIAQLYFAAQKKKYPYDPVTSQTNANGLIMYKLLTGTSWLVPLPGMSGSSRIILADKDDLHYGMDSFLDINSFNVERYERYYKFWLDFDFGTQIIIPEPAAMVVNDLV